MPIVAHRLYVAEPGQPLDLNSPVVEIPMPDNNITLPQEMQNFPSGGLQFVDQEISWQTQDPQIVEYIMGLTSVDDQGRESDMAVFKKQFVTRSAPQPST